jgi:hypothetical protein
VRVAASLHGPVEAVRVGIGRPVVRASGLSDALRGDAHP